MNENERSSKNWNLRYLTAGKGFMLILRQIAKWRFHFSRPPLSTSSARFPISVRSLGNNILDTQYGLWDDLPMNKTLQLPKTLQEAVSFFSDPQKTFDYAVSLRWPTDKVTCPRCDSTEHSFISTRRI